MGCQRHDDFMELCWHFKEFDYVAFRKTAPAKLVSGWCDWMQRRPQGQFHRDRVAADIASAMAAIEGHEMSSDSFLYYAKHEAKQEELCQAQIDANVEWAIAHQSKAVANG